VDSMRFMTYSSFLVLKLKAIMTMVEIYMSKIMLIIDLSTDTFIILMIFLIFIGHHTKKASYIGS